MYLTSNIIKDDRYPDWIKNHQIFKDINRYSKVFPKKGLLNNIVSLDTYLGENCAKKFLDEIIDISRNTLSVISDEVYLSSETHYALYLFFSKFKSVYYIDLKRKNKITLLLSEDIFSISGNIVFKKGTSLFSLLEKDIAIGFSGIDFFKLQSFKDFSRLNIPLSSAEIQFSTEPWDIATMSMRGFTTCQGWDGEYRQCLIGSILDPYVGIIFLASKGKSTEYGSKMLHRAVVRFAIKYDEDKKTKSQVLIIDYIYPEFHSEILKLFSDYLTSKSGLEVLYEPYGWRDMLVYLPRNKLKDTFKFYSEKGKHDRPVRYTDSIESYQNLPVPSSVVNFSDKKLSEQKAEIKRRFYLSIIDRSRISNVGVIKALSINTNVSLLLKNNSLQEQIYKSTKTFCNKLIEEVDLSDKNNSLDEKQYKIKLYFDFFNKKQLLLQSTSNQVLEWNSKLNLKKSSALSKKDYVLLMRQSMQQADQALKAELRGFFARTP